MQYERTFFGDFPHLANFKKNFTFLLASENIRHFVEVGELHSNSRFTSLYVLLRFFTQKWSQKEEYKRKRKKIKKLYSISIPVTSTEIFHRFFTQQSFCCPVCYYIQAFFQILWKSRCNILVSFPSHLKKLHWDLEELKKKNLEFLV